jgi:arabinofuranan 3-O-arabinosyltransferase
MNTAAAIGFPAKGFEITRPIELTCFALCVAQAVCLATALVHGYWVYDSGGQLLASDFVNVWAAGRHVLDGHPAVAYDIALHKDAQVAALGHPFEGAFPWIYPPTFLFPAATLAIAPYVAAYTIWVSLTFAAYLGVMRGIVGGNVGIFLACAYPGILSNFMVGQNGFLTAALIGGALLLMQRRPVVSGCLLGLLSFKPHLGVLVPIALLASGRWSVMSAAAITTVALGAMSWLTFGTAPWEAFFHGLQTAYQSTLADGGADWAKLQSLYGAIRILGGGDQLARALQCALSGLAAVMVFAVWRGRASFDVKAATLVTGALLATPYIFLYDLVALAVAMAFLLRAGSVTGVLPGEIGGLGMACLLVLVFPIATLPVGFAAVLVVAILVARRILTAQNNATRGATGDAAIPAA